MAKTRKITRIPKDVYEAAHEAADMAHGQEINQVALDFVRVLILIHEDEMEAALILPANLGVFFQHFQPEHEQIVEVHHATGVPAPGVAPFHRLDLRCERTE